MENIAERWQTQITTGIRTIQRQSRVAKNIRHAALLKINASEKKCYHWTQMVTPRTRMSKELALI
jgi:hypothetical protein